MDEFMMDDWMLTKVKQPIYETVELHVNALNHRTATPHSCRLSGRFHHGECLCYISSFAH